MGINSKLSSIESMAGLHPVFSKHKYITWDELEEEIRQIENTTEKGDAFEQFCYFFLLYHKDLYHIKEIWCDKVLEQYIGLAYGAVKNFRKMV